MGLESDNHLGKDQKVQRLREGKKDQDPLFNRHVRGSRVGRVYIRKNTRTVRVLETVTLCVTLRFCDHGKRSTATYGWREKE